MPIKKRGDYELTALIAHFAECDKTAKMFATEASKAKAKLMAIVEERGELTEEGHQYLVLDKPVGAITALKREKRKTRVLDEEATYTWLESKGWVAECTEVVEVTEIHEDKLYMLIFEQRATQEEIDALYTETSTFAFIPVK
jgi:hypothetical protein